MKKKEHALRDLGGSGKYFWTIQTGTENIGSKTFFYEHVFVVLYEVSVRKRGAGSASVRRKQILDKAMKYASKN